MIDRAKELLHVRPDRCRDCEQEVNGLAEICPNCGAANPVQIPRWIGLLILGFTLQSFLMMFE